MKKTLTNRLIIGKILGFTVGFLVFLVAPTFDIVIDIMFSLGLIIFYVLMGVTIAFIGLFNRHPVLDFNTPWWLSGMFVGLCFHTMLVLLSYDRVLFIIEQIDILGIQSPWWALLDGLILGLGISYLERRLAGEGNLPIK